MTGSMVWPMPCAPRGATGLTWLWSARKSSRTARAMRIGRCHCAPGKLPPDCSGWHRDPSCGVGLEQEGIDTAGNIRLRFDAEPHHHHDHQCPRPVDQPIEHSLYIVDNDDEVLARMEWLTAVMRDTPASFHIEKKGTATGVSREDGDRIFVLDGIECFAGDVYSIKVTKDTF